MKEIEKEKISALLDGEVGSDELNETLAAALKSLELRKVWGRYNQIKSSLNGENGSDIADKIWTQLEQEPTIMVPGMAPAIKNKFSGAARRFGAGLAIAATVAGLAVGGLRFLAPELSTSTLVASSPEQADYVRANGTRWQLDDPELENDLNVYLVEHGGFAGSSTMNGIQSYVKVAGYDVEK